MKRTDVRGPVRCPRADSRSARGTLRATALYNRGLSQQKLKHPVLAVEDFTSALFLEPEFAHAYYLRGTILRENGQYLFALSDFEKAIRFKHPQAHLVYYGEALTYEALRRPNDAQASFNKAVAANPSFEPARSKLAQLGALPAVADVAVQPEPELITASITSPPEQLVRKETLPEAVKPLTFAGRPAAGRCVQPLAHQFQCVGSVTAEVIVSPA